MTKATNVLATCVPSKSPQFKAGLQVLCSDSFLQRMSCFSEEKVLCKESYDLTDFGECLAPSPSQRLSNKKLVLLTPDPNPC